MALGIDERVAILIRGAGIGFGRLVLATRKRYALELGATDDALLLGQGLLVPRLD